jgi:hypothetical protein
MVAAVTDARRHAGFVVGLAALLHAPSFFKPFMDLDEGSYAAIACRLLDGGVVYHDGVENKFPAVYFIYKDVFAVFGRYNMVAIHVTVTVVAIATALVVGAIASRYAGKAAGRWASLLYVVASASYYPKMLAGNTEMWAVLPAALAVWCYLRGRDRGWAWLVAAGACGALALMCKQVAAATFVALLADRTFTGFRAPLRALRDLVALVLGFAAVVALTVMYLRAVGAWDDAVFWTWTYVIHYYIPAGDSGLVVNLATAFVPFALVMSPLIYLAVRGRDRTQSVVYWWLVGNVCASLVGGRMYGHYFLLFVPALATLAGVGAARYLTVVRATARTLIVAAVALVAAANLVASSVYEAATGAAFSPDPDYRDAAAYVREHTSPDDRIFVWGWFPALYQAADRCPSTRFVYTHIHAGKGGSGLGHDVPEAWAMLMQDLEDAPLWAFFAARYDVATTIAGVRLFKRR